MRKKSWICSQIGSREHYAIPKAIERLGQLRKFYTDIWIPPTYNLPLQLLGSAGTALNNRYDAAIATSTQSIGNLNSIIKETIFKDSNDYKHYCSYGSFFADRVNKYLKKEIKDFDFYFSYNTAALESFYYLKNEGKILILDQIDPGKIEREIVRIENDKFPGWAIDQYHNAPDFYYERIEEEWENANYIIVNSQWSKRALIEQGVPFNKIKIIPLCYEPNFKKKIEKANNTTLTVLYAANVILRKGIQYLIESANQLKEYNIKFLIAGPINISKSVINNAPSNMVFLGKVERNALHNYYLSADLYVLPTLSDGFAITQLEAMSHSLPVITTERCGEVVSNEIDGYIIEPYSAESISKAIIKFYDNRQLLKECSKMALKKSTKFSQQNLMDHLSIFFI